MKKIGVLSLQGDFAAHGRSLDRLGVAWREVRRAGELDETDGLILPGGESTTMLKFLREENLMLPLRAYAQAGKPMFGTCAGAILMAHRVTHPEQESLDLLDITVVRNGYGRQINSFIKNASFPKLGCDPLEIVFIRAPVIADVGPEVEVLLEYDGNPILVRQGALMAATFHPELSSDHRIHQMFVEVCFRG